VLPPVDKWPGPDTDLGKVRFIKPSALEALIQKRKTSDYPVPFGNNNVDFQA
jgi:hypothetical protein